MFNSPLYPVNMLDSVYIWPGLAGNHWPDGWSGTDDSCTPACFRTGSIWPKPDTARTKSDPCWFCTILSGTSVEKQNRVWKWETGSGPVVSCQKPGQMIPAHQLASRLEAFGQNLTRPSRLDPGSVLHNVIYAFFGKMELKWMSEVRSGIYSQPDSGWP